MDDQEPRVRWAHDLIKAVAIYMSAGTGRDHPKLNDIRDGQYEFSINMISPFSDDAAAPDAERMRNMGREELAIVLQPDVRFMRDLTLLRQTDKFIRQSRSGSSQSGRDRIILEKGEQNGRRAKDLGLQLRKLIALARPSVRGDELDMGWPSECERDRFRRPRPKRAESWKM